jgi:HK97 family phage prohead protease
MPYTIIENATGCDGYAVVKENETTPVPGGCHETMDEAQAHLVALEIATADEYTRALDSYQPSDGMVVEAQRGLDWRREYGRGGTAVGIARARDIVNRRDLPVDTWRRIKAYFDRHEIDKQGEGWSPGETGYPSNGRIAWALWGGDAGWSRAKTIMETVANDDSRIDMNETETRDGEGIYPLTPRQTAQYDADESLVELFGKYDQGIGPDGAHYVAQSPFADDGMVCSSCVFFEGGNACEIVDGEIAPEGICKRWIIAGDLIGSPADAPVETEMEPAMDDEQMEQPVRYSTLEIENRRVGGRDVEFRSVEVGGLELRAADGTSDGPIEFSGYAAVFNSPSEPLPFIETIAPGAFRRTLNSGREVRLFINHDMGQPLATTRNGSLRLTEDERGLKVDATLPDTTAARDLATLIDAGVVHSMSFGFSIPTGGDAWSDDGNSRELREVMLVETSIVTGFPAYPATTGAQIRALDEIDDADNETTAPVLPVALARRMIELTAKR